MGTNVDRLRRPPRILWWFLRARRRPRIGGNPWRAGLATIGVVILCGAACTRERATPAVTTPEPFDTPPGAVDVRVVETSGALVPGATVKAWIVANIREEEALDPYPPHDEGLTDERGSARLRLPSTHVIVTASREDVGTSGMYYWAGEERRVTLTLRPQARLRVRTLGVGDRPIRRVRVELGWSWLPERRSFSRFPPAVKTDRDGYAELMVDAPFTGAVKAQLTNGERTEVWVDVKPGEDREIIVPFRPRDTLAGQVLGPDGRGVPGASVSALGRESRDNAEGRTDAHGRFLLSCAAQDEYVVTAEAEGLVLKRAGAVFVSRDRPAEDVVVELRPAASITGYLVRSDGTPAAGESVWGSVFEPDVRQLGRIFGADVVERFGRGALTSSLGVDSTEAAEDGSFESGSAHPDFRYMLTVPSGRPPATQFTKRVAEPGESVRIVLKDEPPMGTVRGVVRDAATGEPVPRFRARAMRWESYTIHPMPDFDSWVEDPLGRLEIPRLLCSAAYLVIIEAEGYSPTSAGPLVPADAGELDFVLSRFGGLTVTVAANADVDEELVAHLFRGQPWTSDEEIWPMLERRLVVGEAITWRPMGVGDYVVRVRDEAGRSACAEVTVEEGRETSLVLAPAEPTPATLRLRVIGHDGEPVVDSEVGVGLYEVHAAREKGERGVTSRVRLVAPFGSSLRLTTDPFGDVVLEGVPSGRLYSLSVRRQNDWGHDRRLVVPAVGEVAATVRLAPIRRR